MKYQLEKFNLSRSGPFFERVFLGGAVPKFLQPSLFSPKKVGGEHLQRSYSIQGPKLHSALLATCEAMNLGFVEGNTWKNWKGQQFLQYLDAGFNHFDLDFCLGEDFRF